MVLSSLTGLAAALPQETDGAVGGTVAIFAVVYLVVFIAAYAVTALGYAGVFKKAGEPGWAGWVPIYNQIVVLKIVGRPAWWVLGYFVPIVNLVVTILVMIDLSRSFGHDIGFAVGLILVTVVFMYIIWLGDSQYRGPAAAQPGGFAPGGSPGGYGGHPQGYPAPGQAQGFAAPQAGYAPSQPGYAQPSAPQPGYPQPSAAPQPGFPQPGFPQPSAAPQPGYAPPPPGYQQPSAAPQPGYAPPQPGYPQPSAAPQPGYPQPPAAPQPGYTPPQPGYPSQPGSGQPGYPGQSYPGQPS